LGASWAELRTQNSELRTQNSELRTQNSSKTKLKLNLKPDGELLNYFKRAGRLELKNF